jgi:hypothetical protein
MRSGAGVALAVSVVLILAACGASSPTAWGGLQRVRVTVSQPSLPPPGGRPRTSTFSSGLRLIRARAALIAYRIHHTSAKRPGGGCAGGIQIALTIEQQHQAPLRLQAYRCAGSMTGDVGGNLTGFLSALGISVS